MLARTRLSKASSGWPRASSALANAKRRALCSLTVKRSKAAACRLRRAKSASDAAEPSFSGCRLTRL